MQHSTPHSKTHYGRLHRTQSHMTTIHLLNEGLVGMPSPSCGLLLELGAVQPESLRNNNNNKLNPGLQKSVHLRILFWLKFCTPLALTLDYNFNSRYFCTSDYQSDLKFNIRVVAPKPPNPENICTTSNSNNFYTLHFTSQKFFMPPSQTPEIYKLQP